MGGALFVVALCHTVASAPRSYDGLTEVAAPTSTDVARTQPTAARRANAAVPNPQPTPSTRRSALRLPGEMRFDPLPDGPPPRGTGMLAVGGVLAGVGLVGEGVRIAGLTTGEFEMTFFGGLFAPGFFGASLPFLGVGMHRRTFAGIGDARRRAEPLPRAPSRARVGVGATFTVLGTAAMLTGFSLPVSLAGAIATWTGYPVLLTGTLLLAEAHARRRARKRFVGSLLPSASPRMLGVVASGRF